MHFEQILLGSGASRDWIRANVSRLTFYSWHGLTLLAFGTIGSTSREARFTTTYDDCIVKCRWTQPIGPPYTGNVDQALKNAQNGPNQLARRMENYMVAAMSYLLDNPPYIDGL